MSHVTLFQRRSFMIWVAKLRHSSCSKGGKSKYYLRNDQECFVRYKTQRYSWLLCIQRNNTWSKCFNGFENKPLYSLTCEESFKIIVFLAAKFSEKRKHAFITLRETARLWSYFGFRSRIINEFLIIHYTLVSTANVSIVMIKFKTVVYFVKEGSNINFTSNLSHANQNLRQSTLTSTDGRSGVEILMFLCGKRRFKRPKGAYFSFDFDCVSLAQCCLPRILLFFWLFTILQNRV